MTTRAALEPKIANLTAFVNLIANWRHLSHDLCSCVRHCLHTVMYHDPIFPSAGSMLFPTSPVWKYKWPYFYSESRRPAFRSVNGELYSRMLNSTRKKQNIVPGYRELFAYETSHLSLCQSLQSKCMRIQYPLYLVYSVPHIFPRILLLFSDRVPL